MPESPIKKTKKYSTGALPKAVLAEAIGIRRKLLNQWIKDADLFAINRNKFFKPFEVELVLNQFGDFIEWAVIDRYKEELRRRGW